MMWATAVPPVIVTSGSGGLDGTAWVVIITTLFASISGSVVAIITAWRATTARTEIMGGVNEIGAAVRTANELSMGQLAERGETRRIQHDVRIEDRTEQETRHMDQAAERGDPPISHDTYPTPPADQPSGEHQVMG